MDKQLKWLFATALGLFFTTGLLGGIMLERKVLFPSYNRQAPASAQLGAARPGEAPAGAPLHQAPRERFLAQLNRELSLSHDQEAEILKILQSNETELESIRTQIKSKLDALETGLAEKIVKVLNSGQKAVFQERYREWLHQGPPPVDMGPGRDGQGPVPPRGQGAAPGPPPPPPGAPGTPPLRGGQMPDGMRDGMRDGMPDGAPRGPGAGQGGR